MASIPLQIQFHLAKFAYKATKNFLPANLHNLFQSLLLITCSQAQIINYISHGIIPSLVYKSMHVWNCLSYTFKNAKSAPIFRLKTYLQSLDFLTYQL